MGIMPVKNEFFQVRDLILAIRSVQSRHSRIVCWMKEENGSGHVSIKKWVSLRKPMFFSLPQGGHFHNFTTSSQGSLKFCSLKFLEACCDPIVTKQATPVWHFTHSPTHGLHRG